jgi:lipoprotein-anchoring transpeptidase ErfK/SrfK
MAETVLVTRTTRTLAALALTAALAAPALAAEEPAPTETPKPTYKRLSDENKLSRWAYTNLTSKIRKKPSTKARAIGKLHFNTEDGPPEVYLALRLYTAANGDEWVETRVPGRPNGRKGWVPREGLGEFHVLRTHLVINRKTLKATLFKKGRKAFSTRVGVGKSSTPTPAGHFWIRERLNGFGNAVYGPVAFGTGAYSAKLSDWPGGGVIGIHGTNQPNLIPGRPSHGCIRMKNSAILRLKKLMPVGTPLTIV